MSDNPYTHFLNVLNRWLHWAAAASAGQDVRDTIDELLKQWEQAEKQTLTAIRRNGKAPARFFDSVRKARVALDYQFNPGGALSMETCRGECANLLTYLRIMAANYEQGVPQAPAPEGVLHAENVPGSPPPTPGTQSDRPPAPTGDYCLLSGCRVRWESITSLQPLLWRLLQFFLSQAVEEVDEEVAIKEVWGDDEEVKSKTFANAVSRLNAQLTRISFPWVWHMKNGKVHVEK